MCDKCFLELCYVLRSSCPTKGRGKWLLILPVSLGNMVSTGLTGRAEEGPWPLVSDVCQHGRRGSELSWCQPALLKSAKAKKTCTRLLRIRGEPHTYERQCDVGLGSVPCGHHNGRWDCSRQRLKMDNRMLWHCEQSSTVILLRDACIWIRGTSGRAV